MPEMDSSPESRTGQEPNLVLDIKDSVGGALHTLVRTADYQLLFE